MKSIELTGFDLLKNLPKPLQSEIKQQPLLSLKQGDYIVKKGHKNDALHLLIEGEVALYLHEADEPLKILRAGDTIGEISMIDQNPASASTICLCPCKIIAINESLIWKLAKNNHPFTLKLLRLAVSRFRSANSQLESSIQRHRQLEHHASIDNLTGLFNRGWLNKKFNSLLERCKKDQKAFSYLMLDIDHFKKVNDNYGHLVGDLVLQKTAEMLNNIVRTADYVVRYGGEEIAILLPNATADNAVKLAERICKIISYNEIEYETNKTLTITLSIGVSTLTNNESTTELIKLADTALYYAKAHGRNQVKFMESRLPDSAND